MTVSMRHRELKACLYIVLAITLAAELLGLTGLTTSPHRELLRILFSDYGIFLIGGITVHAFLMKLFSPVEKREIIFIVSAGIVFSLGYLGYNDTSNYPYWYMLSIPAAGLGVAAFCVILFRSFSRTAAVASVNRDLLIGSVAVYLVALNINCYLQLTSAIHPVVYDPSAYEFDMSLGANFSAYLAVLLDAHPWLHKLVSYAYSTVPYGFSILFGLYVAKPDKAPANVLLAIFISMVGAYLAYHIAPAAGPKYAFGNLFRPPCRRSRHCRAVRGSSLPPPGTPYRPCTSAGHSSCGCFPLITRYPSGWPSACC